MTAVLCFERKPTVCYFFKVSICHRRKDFQGKEFNAGLSVWSASMERCGRPRYTATPGKKSRKKFGVCWKLLMPLRCPPTVQRALMLVQPWLDRKNVCFFKKVCHPDFYYFFLGSSLS